jgi:hypothetical protein
MIGALDAAVPMSASAAPNNDAEMRADTVSPLC